MAGCFDCLQTIECPTHEHAVFNTLSKCSVEGVEGGVNTLECNKATHLVSLQSRKVNIIHLLHN